MRPNCETARASSAFYYPTKVTRSRANLRAPPGAPHLARISPASSCTRGSLQYLAATLAVSISEAWTLVTPSRESLTRRPSEFGARARALTRSAKGARDPMTGMESNSVSLGRVSLDRYGFSAIIFQPTSAVEFNNECSRTLERLRED